MSFNDTLERTRVQILDEAALLFHFVGKTLMYLSLWLWTNIRWSNDSILILNLRLINLGEEKLWRRKTLEEEKP